MRDINLDMKNTSSRKITYSVPGGEAAENYDKQNAAITHQRNSSFQSQQQQHASADDFGRSSGVSVAQAEIDKKILDIPKLELGTISPQNPKTQDKLSVKYMNNVLITPGNKELQTMDSDQTGGTHPSFLPSDKRIKGKKRPKAVGLDDFDFLAVLGKGNFGKVMLAQEKTTRSVFAIKVLKKDFIIENDEVESTKSEKRVFISATETRHPFLVNLHSSFQTESRLYFVMEFVSGGDLMWHIQHEVFSAKRAKFYACEVLLAIEYLHSKDICYRDLKMDNILLTSRGHIKIADYGLCKESMVWGATTSTFCGTPEFMAPEILSEKPYTRAVDWWAFGVLIYEMLLGQSPFKGNDEEEIFDAILNDEIVFPSKLTSDAVSVLKQVSFFLG